MLVHMCSYAPVFSPCSFRNYFNPFCQVSQLSSGRREDERAKETKRKDALKGE